MYFLQSYLARKAYSARQAMFALPPLVILSLACRLLNVGAAVPNAAVAVSCILRLTHLKYAIDKSRFESALNLDFRCHDIPQAEFDSSAATRLPRQNIRFASWTDQECYDFTSFRKSQLIRIYKHFNLENIATQQLGSIRVSNGSKYYAFDPEEIFLFFMTKCKTGLSNKVMCDLIFGGNATRWSYGWRWILFYVDERYERVIGHEKLVDFVHEFPKFYNAINKCVQKTTTHHFSDGTAEDRPGLNFLPFDIFSFIDCSIDRINVPFSGPDGDFIGAPRRPFYQDAQQSVYTGYKKVHGIKVEVVMLPNGICSLYGPVSARAHDVEGVLNMSGLDDFLFAIQQNRNHIYMSFGDSAYSANGLRCKLQDEHIQTFSITCLTLDFRLF